MFRAHYDMGFGHAVNIRIKGNLFWFNYSADGVTQIDLGNFKLVFGENCTEFALAFNLCQLFNIFHVFLIGFSIPEHYTELDSVWFLEGEYQGSVWQVAPLIVGSDGSTEDIGSRCNSHSQTCTLPRYVGDSLSIWDSKIF